MTFLIVIAVVIAVITLAQIIEAHRRRKAIDEQDSGFREAD